MADALIHAAMVPTHDANIADIVCSIHRLIDDATLVCICRKELLLQLEVLSPERLPERAD